MPPMDIISVQARMAISLHPRRSDGIRTGLHRDGLRQKRSFFRLNEHDGKESICGLGLNEAFLLSSVCPNAVMLLYG